MTATRWPDRSAAWSQRAVCSVVPANDSTPSMSGCLGWVSTPVASITWRAVTSSPAEVVSVQVFAASSKTPFVTRVLKRARAARPCSRAMSSA